MIGYGWLSNQHGLGIDNILSYELVKPNGNVVTVTAKSNPDLFFALKGSSNNFVRDNLTLVTRVIRVEPSIIGYRHQLHDQYFPAGHCLGECGYLVSPAAHSNYVSTRAAPSRSPPRTSRRSRPRLPSSPPKSLTQRHPWRHITSAPSDR